MKLLFQKKQLLGILLTLLIVFLTTRLGGLFVPSVDGLSIFWPPNAILLSLLLILDRKYGLVCLGLCFPMYLTAELWSGYNFKIAVLFSLANCIEVASIFLVITSYLKTPYNFARFHSFLFFLFTIVLGALIGGVIGAYAIYLNGGSYLQALIEWILADSIAFLIFTPLILTLQQWPVRLRNVSRNGKFEAIGAFGLMLLLLAISHGAMGMEILRFVGIQVVAVGLVFFSAIRFGIVGVSLSSVLFSLLIVSLQFNGLGAFVEFSERSGIVWMQIYVLVVIFSSMSLAILIAERDTAFASLEQINAGLESVIADRSKELLRTTKQLAAAQKIEAIARVTGGVAHDFNNLLAIIQINLDIIEATKHNGKSDTEMLSIQGAVESGSTLTQRLLAYSRKTSLSPQPTNVGELIVGRTGIFQRLLGETVELTYEIESTLWLVLTDTNRFEDVLLNLVVNARDAMTNGGELHIKAENANHEELPDELLNDMEAGSFVLITIADTGCGIQSDVLSKVFDPFFTTKEIGRGSGLGLSMAYGFAKQSHGLLMIESNPGVSTTVKLYLPRAMNTDEVVYNPGKPSKHIDRETCRILVVEDEPELMKVCKRVLISHGFTVTSAINGREALVILGEDDPVDILFSDIVLPGDMSGFDIQKEANRLQPGIGSILTTGYADLRSTGNSQLIANTDILYKPYSIHDLLERIDLTLKAMTV